VSEPPLFFGHPRHRADFCLCARAPRASRPRQLALSHTSVICLAVKKQPCKMWQGNNRRTGWCVSPIFSRSSALCLQVVFVRALARFLNLVRVCTDSWVAPRHSHFSGVLCRHPYLFWIKVPRFVPLDGGMTPGKKKCTFIVYCSKKAIPHSSWAFMCMPPGQLFNCSKRISCPASWHKSRRTPREIQRAVTSTARA